jgi:uncharacterized protein (DUF952 family)
MIYHITERTTWEKDLDSCRYSPLAFAADGFIHCSNYSQVMTVANRFYAGQQDLILLAIDPSKVEPKIVSENLEGGVEIFPHIYGTLNTDAVFAISTMTVNADGMFEFPVKWEVFSG